MHQFELPKMVLYLAKCQLHWIEIRTVSDIVNAFNAQLLHLLPHHLASVHPEIIKEYAELLTFMLSSELN